MFKPDCSSCAHFEVCRYPDKIDEAESILEQRLKDVFSFMEITLYCKHFMVDAVGKGDA